VVGHPRTGIKKKKNGKIDFRATPKSHPLDRTATPMAKRKKQNLKGLTLGGGSPSRVGHSRGGSTNHLFFYFFKKKKNFLIYIFNFIFLINFLKI